MPGFKVLATNHTSFTVSDLDRSVAFFRDGDDWNHKGTKDTKGSAKELTGCIGIGMTRCWFAVALASSTLCVLCAFVVQKSFWFKRVHHSKSSP
jgi:catechol 2,3-dioxygenase-like lactoylglutathione lyase family enzyme